MFVAKTIGPLPKKRVDQCLDVPHGPQLMRQSCRPSRGHFLGWPLVVNPLGVNGRFCQMLEATHKSRNFCLGKSLSIPRLKSRHVLGVAYKRTALSLAVVACGVKWLCAATDLERTLKRKDFAVNMPIAQIVETIGNAPNCCLDNAPSPLMLTLKPPANPPALSIGPDDRPPGERSGRCREPRGDRGARLPQPRYASRTIGLSINSSLVPCSRIRPVSIT